ncbi:unnamed protein product [Darwinula stevensoni]|uniref:WAP domain-containing protein n=1 Tax=Darwinula stevensoni TaxID=69355 RepID=A0A7R9A2G8_9CRUS|nr:unnamed protein product [Darwinula stevensoni]CAG0888673.1 unnamed protein product [Darwinula stevensoni]
MTKKTGFPPSAAGTCPLEGRRCWSTVQWVCDGDADCVEGFRCCEGCDGGKGCVGAGNEQCPKRKDMQCPPSCSSDSDCQNGLLCCQNCHRKICMPPVLTCNDTKCANGETCAMVHPICRSSDIHCHLKPFCLPAGKPVSRFRVILPDGPRDPQRGLSLHSSVFPSGARSCESVECIGRRRCELKEVTCIASPCYPIPKGKMPKAQEWPFLMEFQLAPTPPSVRSHFRLTIDEIYFNLERLRSLKVEVA